MTRFKDGMLSFNDYSIHSKPVSEHGIFPTRAKLALKAAQETTGDSRQQNLLQANTDLAAVVMEPERIQEIVSRRTFGIGWTGSRHAYEAGLLSCIDDFRGDARSRLRMAWEWVKNLSRLTDEERKERENYRPRYCRDIVGSIQH